MPVNESKFIQARIPKPTAKRLLKIARRQHRMNSSVNQEVNTAVNEYVHKHEYHDDGR